MATPGYMPHLTVEHRDTKERIQFKDMSVKDALETVMQRHERGGSERVDTFPPLVFESTCVHLEGSLWLVKLPAPPVPRSVWRNFKGPVVRVVDTFRHTETMEPMVAYDEPATGGCWVRPLLMFMEHVGPDMPRFIPMTGFRG
mgnify:CR=1 FL=1